MGFCSRCGEIAFAERCRCGGKVKDSSASGLNGRDAWRSTYLDNKKPYTPTNLVKLGGSHIDHKLSLNENSPENKALPLQKSASETPKQKLNECEKCRLPITGSATTWIYYNAKKWHKDCMRCKFCNKLMDYPEVDLEENPCCSECFDLHGSKSVTKQKLASGTPEIVVDKPIVTVSRSSAVRPKSQFIAKSNTEPQVDKLADKVEKLDIKGSRLSSNLEILRSKSKSFSKTFDTLQADIERSGSISRHRPKLSGDMTLGGGAGGGTLSYKDLLSHRSSISRTPSIHRDIMGTFEDRRTKRMSVPANFSQPSASNSATSSRSATPDLASGEGSQSSVDSSTSKRNMYNSRRSTTYLGNGISSPLRTTLGKTKEEFEPISPVKSNPSNEFSDAPTNTEVTSEPRSYDYSDFKLTKEKSKPEPEINHHTETTKSSATTIDSNPVHSITNTTPAPINSSNGTGYTKLDNHSTDGGEKTCSKCTLPFTNKWYQLTDSRALHPECFLCNGCNQSIKDGIYSIHEDREYHSECLPKSAGLFSPDLGSPDQDIKCNRCLKLVQGACYTLSDGRNFHMNCFICNECSLPFKSGSYVVYEGKEFHKECVPKLNLVQCSKCKKSINGKYVQNKGNNFHPECFTCYGCNKHISPNTPFGELESKPYCEPCISLKIKAKHSTSFALSAAYQERRKRDSALYN